MSTSFPLKFTLEDGVIVEVSKAEGNTYDFALTPPEGTTRHFTYDDNEAKDKVIEDADFDKLNAIRRFWLEREDVI
jgi:hypothetical protein